MEVSCSNCPARYAVPDAKVRGRKVRIQCKRCKAAIVVDGTHLAAAKPTPQPPKAEPPAAASPSAEAPAASPAASPAAARAATGKAKQLEAAPRPRMDSGWREPGAVSTPEPRVPGASTGGRPHAAMKRTMIGGLGGPGADADPEADASRAAPEPPAPIPKPELKPPAPSPAPAEVASPPRPGAGAGPRQRSAIKKTMIGIPPPAAEPPAPVPPAPAPPAPAPPEPELPPIAKVESPITEPPRPGMAAEWTVAITDDQHEELTTSEVVELYIRGGIDFETFIWADGMDDWKQPWEIPLLAVQLRQRGLVPPGEGDQIIPSSDFDSEDEHTVVAQGPSFARADQSGSWREPGGWGEQAPADISFEDVTVSMDAPHAALLLRESSDDADDVTMDAEVDELLDAARPAGTPYAAGYDSVPVARVEPDFADDSYDLTDQMVRPAGLGEAPYAIHGAPHAPAPSGGADALDFYVPQPPQPPVSAPFEYPAASAPQAHANLVGYSQQPQFAPPPVFAPAAMPAKKSGGGGLFIVVIILILLLCAVAVAYVTRQPPQLWERLPF